MKKFIIHAAIVLAIEAILFVVAYYSFEVGYTTGVQTVMTMVGMSR